MKKVMEVYIQVYFVFVESFRLYNMFWTKVNDTQNGS